MPRYKLHTFDRGRQVDVYERSPFGGAGRFLGNTYLEGSCWRVRLPIGEGFRYVTLPDTYPTRGDALRAVAWASSPAEAE